MKIAITGASGELGRLIVNRLLTKIPAEQIVALARTPEKLDDLNIEVRKANYDLPETLTAALNGLDTLMFISGSEVGQRVEQHKNIIKAAQIAGIQYIVYTSLLHADDSILSLAGEHRETEKLLKDSGITTTILRNGWYTENYTDSIGFALANGAFLGSAKQGRISSAPRSDYADAAVTVLTTEGHDGKIYELAGDDSYTLSELAQEISKQTNLEIPYTDLSPADYTEVLIKAGLPEPLPEILPSFDVDASKDALFDDSRELSKLIGRPTTSMKESVARVLSAIK